MGGLLLSHYNLDQYPDVLVGKYLEGTVKCLRRRVNIKITGDDARVSFNSTYKYIHTINPTRIHGIECLYCHMRK